MYPLTTDVSQHLQTFLHFPKTPSATKSRTASSDVGAMIFIFSCEDDPSCGVSGDLLPAMWRVLPKISGVPVAQVVSNGGFGVLSTYLYLRKRVAYEHLSIAKSSSVTDGSPSSSIA